MLGGFGEGFKANYQGGIGQPVQGTSEYLNILRSVPLPDRWTDGTLESAEAAGTVQAAVTRNSGADTRNLQLQGSQGYQPPNNMYTI